MKKISEIAESINRIRQDIKAEVLIADYMEKGLNPDDFVVFASGTFKRRFSTDIRKADLLRLNNIQTLLGIHLNRDGIYDSLPEGFFHSPPEKPPQGSGEMSTESKKMRIEEKESRTFFAPFENEIFLQRVNLEMQERKILDRFSESLFDEIYPEFWNFDRSADPGLISRMVLLLHFSYRASGNPEMTSYCLGAILNEDVVCNLIPPAEKPKEAEPERQLSLGVARLGMDFVCGSCFDDLLPAMEFQIGPLKNTPVTDYLESGRISNFLKYFYDYFVPSGFDVITRVIADRSQHHFNLGERKNAPVLGYNSAI